MTPTFRNLNIDAKEYSDLGLLDRIIQIGILFLAFSIFLFSDQKLITPSVASYFFT